MTCLPIYTPHWDAEKRVQVQTSLLIFKRPAFILAAVRFCDRAEAGKYQEGVTVKGGCHSFSVHVCPCPERLSLIWRLFIHILNMLDGKRGCTTRLLKHIIIGHS